MKPVGLLSRGIEFRAVFKLPLKMESELQQVYCKLLLVTLVIERKDFITQIALILV